MIGLYKGKKMFILKEWKNEIEKPYILKKDFDGLQWKTYALNEFRPFNFQTQAYPTALVLTAIAITMIGFAMQLVDCFAIVSNWSM